MATVTLSPSLLSILSGNPEVQKGVEEAAQEILSAADAIVPVGPTGDLKASGRVELDLNDEGQLTAKVIYGGGATYYAIFVEFGTSVMGPQPFVRGGAEAAGYTVHGG